MAVATGDSESSSNRRISGLRISLDAQTWYRPADDRLLDLLGAFEDADDLQEATISTMHELAATFG